MFNRALPEFGNSNHVLLQREDVPRFENWLNTLGLTVRHADVFRKFPGWPENRMQQDRATIHIDGNDFDDHAKINFVYNSGNSRIVWYKLKPGAESFSDQSGAYTPSRSAWDHDCEEVCSTLTNRPMLVNVGQLHDIRDVDQLRYCFSFQLAPIHDPHSKIYWHQLPQYFSRYMLYQS